MAKMDTGIEKGIGLEIKISPTIIMYMGKTKLGVITFDDLSDTGKFLRRLSKSIKQIIREFEDEKKRTRDRGVKCRS
jgi:CRISPR/Cas system endoribonuclease Cas6 (RAMP superfamily)